MDLHVSLIKPITSNMIDNLRGIVSQFSWQRFPQRLNNQQFLAYI